MLRLSVPSGGEAGAESGWLLLAASKAKASSRPDERRSDCERIVEFGGL